VALIYSGIIRLREKEQGGKAMNKLIFARALKRVLLSRLPQDGDYQWSNKIEGMLIRSEESTAFDKVVFVIDTALTPEQLLLLSHETYMVIRKNYNGLGNLDTF
jgi:hypothetical protein